MREILFRAKRIDNGEWVEGQYAYILNPLTESGEPIKHLICNGTNIFNDKIDPETLCQYTGLKDKNGNRIWENDIVGAWSEGKHTIGRVKRRVDGLYIIYPSYQKQEFWGLCPDENGKTTVEVIGNIFDNTELLKGEQGCRN